MSKNDPVPDGIYQLGADGELVDYAAKWAYGYIVGTTSVSLGFPNRGRSVTRVARDLGWKLFGVWTDPFDNQVWIDPVRHIDSLEDALRAAVESNQIAIYDLRQQKVIQVDDVV